MQAFVNVTSSTIVYHTFENIGDSIHFKSNQHNLWQIADYHKSNSEFRSKWGKFWRLLKKACAVYNYIQVTYINYSV